MIDCACVSLCVWDGGVGVVACSIVCVRVWLCVCVVGCV